MVTVPMVENITLMNCFKFELKKSLFEATECYVLETHTFSIISNNFGYAINF